MNEKMSGAIGLSRIWLMIGVVMFHSTLLSAYDGVRGYESAVFVMKLVNNGFCHVCVALFYFLSGMLFYKDWRFSISAFRHKMARRMHTLVVPYLFWCAIGMLLFIAKASPYLSVYFPHYADAATTFPRILLGFWSIGLIGGPSGYPFDLPLWFLRNLIVCIALVPLLNYCFKLGWAWLLVAYLLLNAFLSWGIMAAGFYFSVGAMMSVKQVDLERLLARKAPVIISTAIYSSFAVTAAIVDMDVLDRVWPIVNLFGILAMLGISYHFSDIMRGQFARFVSSALFFVYAFHGLWATSLRRLVDAAVAPEGSASLLACFAAIFLIQWGVCLGLFYCLRRVAPRFTAVITGGRSATGKKAAPTELARI